MWWTKIYTSSTDYITQFRPNTIDITAMLMVVLGYLNNRDILHRTGTTEVGSEHFHGKEGVWGSNPHNGSS